MEDGYLRPVAFLLAEKMGLSEELQKSALTLTPGTGDTVRNLSAADDINPADVVVLIIDLVFTVDDALQLLKSTLPPEAVGVVQKLQDAGAQLNIENPNYVLLTKLMQYLGIDHKDISLLAVEKAIRSTDAFALIQLDEAFVAEAQGEAEMEEASKHVGPVETMKGAVEAIMCMLETEGLVRMMTQVFERDVPKTGKITNFTKLREMTDEPGSSMKLTGRYTHLFNKVRDQPPKPVAPNAN